MATKKTATKKPKRVAHKKPARAKAKNSPEKVAKKKPAPNRAAKKKVAAAKGLRKKSQRMGDGSFPPERRGARSGEQSGDLQGLPDLEAADSESVDDLIEEGNAFEADVVAGVESAGDADEKEVRTHEVPDDDVPEEYLDKE